MKKPIDLSLTKGEIHRELMQVTVHAINVGLNPNLNKNNKEKIMSNTIEGIFHVQHNNHSFLTSFPT